MLSFELTAIDLILVLAVMVLLMLYWTKLSKIPEKQIVRRPTTKAASPERLATRPQSRYGECPRGFGYIKKIGDDGSVSERCLGCYRIMECYGESEEVKPQLDQV